MNLKRATKTKACCNCKHCKPIPKDEHLSSYCEESNLKPIEPAAVDMLIAAGALVVHGAIDKVQISAEGSTITIAVGSKGQVKVTRKETRGISAEC